MMRSTSAVLALVAFVYLGACAALFFFQRSLIYFQLVDRNGLASLRTEVADKPITGRLVDIIETEVSLQPKLVLVQRLPPRVHRSQRGDGGRTNVERFAHLMQQGFGQGGEPIQRPTGCPHEQQKDGGAGPAIGPKSLVERRHVELRQPEVLLDVELGESAWQAIGAYIPEFIAGHETSPIWDEVVTLLERPTAPKAAPNLALRLNRVNLHRKYDYPQLPSMVSSCWELVRASR